MTQEMIIALISAVVSVSGTSGFWAYITKRSTTAAAQQRLIMGLAYDKIIVTGMAYIQRGWISKDEYEEYLKNLVEPYREMGGNGVADRVATEVGSLRLGTVQLINVVSKENANANE